MVHDQCDQMLDYFFKYLNNHNDNRTNSMTFLPNRIKICPLVNKPSKLSLDSNLFHQNFAVISGHSVRDQPNIAVSKHRKNPLFSIFEKQIYFVVDVLRSIIRLLL